MKKLLIVDGNSILNRAFYDNNFLQNHCITPFEKIKYFFKNFSKTY